MLAPLALCCGLSAAMNKISAATAQKPAVLCLLLRLWASRFISIFLVFTGIFDHSNLLVHLYCVASLRSRGTPPKRTIFWLGKLPIYMGVNLSGLVAFDRETSSLASPALFFADFAPHGGSDFAASYAYDTPKYQATPYLARAHHGDQEWRKKSGIMGALRPIPELSSIMFMMLLQPFRQPRVKHAVRPVSADVKKTPTRLSSRWRLFFCLGEGSLSQLKTGSGPNNSSTFRPEDTYCVSSPLT